ncbi:MAG TPA: hypothetical protein VMT64_13525, partial [Candidatus Binataceae bacterium]|nr:hypothetical protein [Candidatus Binataceae bacterium]
MNRLWRYLGRDRVLPSAHDEGLIPTPDPLGEVDLVRMVVRIADFESLLARMDLRELGAMMIKFYGAVADAIMEADTDVNRFCGPEIVGHFNVLHKVDEARIVEGAMNAYRAAQSAFDAEWNVSIGVGLCRGVAIAGAFGSSNRVTVTAFGAADICAHRLAERGAALHICDEFASHFSRPQ